MDLLFHEAALGDFVLTFPLLRGLGGSVTVVAPWSRANLAARVLPAVSAMDIEMFEFVRLHAEGGPSHVSPAVGDLFAQADRVISFISTGRDAWAANVKRFAADALCCFVDPRPSSGWKGHVTAWHHEQLARQGVDLADSRVTAGGDAEGPVLVHPGSGGLAKCWPAERYEALIAALREQGHMVRPVLGEVEQARWPEERLARWRDDWGAVCCRSALELLPVITGGSCYIGNDAGPTHLAAQLGLPTLALFGPTDPARWSPVGPRVRVLAPPDGPGTMDWLGVEPVCDAVGGLLGDTMPVT